MLAVQLMRAQDIDVLGLFFETPFFTSEKARKSAGSLRLPLDVIDITDRHLEVVKRPKHGYGGNMNPCIDCHALMFRIAGEMLETKGAAFVVTGEVLGQRPMSQNRKSLALIASESGLEGLLLRPLSAKLLDPTTAETQAWVKRDLFMGFQGRSRKPQIEMAERLNIKNYPSPGGGCLLTEPGFSRRLADLMASPASLGTREIELLKLGRYFKIGSSTKLVVGRNKSENEAIKTLSGEEDLTLNSASAPGPTSIMLGAVAPDAVGLAAAITAAYSDAESGGNCTLKVQGPLGQRPVTVRVQDKRAFKDYIL